MKIYRKVLRFLSGTLNLVRQKKFWMRFFVYSLVIVAATILGKYIWYEAAIAHYGIRECIGKEVIYIDREVGLHGSRIHKGILRGIKYRLNDRMAFFDLEITIRCSNGQISTGLEPWGLDRIALVRPQSLPEISSGCPSRKSHPAGDGAAD